MSAAEERQLRERFAALAGPTDGDWRDVRRRARRRTGIVLVAAAVVLVALGGAGLAIGARVIGFFDVHGKRIPLSSLSEQEREFLVISMCPHPTLRTAPDRVPKPSCREGEPAIEEIASDGSLAHYRITYPWGLRCLATGRAGGFRNPTFGRRLIGSMGCNRGFPVRSLLPTPRRPITFDVTGYSTRTHPQLLMLRVSGLAGDGIARIALLTPSGHRVVTAVRDHAFSFSPVPKRRWIVAALGPAGRVLYREPLFGGRPPPHERPPPRPKARRRPIGPVGQPVQQASTGLASVDVYRTGFVVLRFNSTTSTAYQRLSRSSRHSNGNIGLTCGTVAYGAGRWEHLGGGVSRPLASTVRSTVSGGPIGGTPPPPFDYCEINGTYGRYWNDEEGTHELVEVPLTAAGRRYLDDRATARDLAYFVRTKRMVAIRRAIHRGEPAPSASDLSRMFGERLVPLRHRNARPPAGKVGVWTDGRLIVASELTPSGRRLYVTTRDVFIGANNIRGLAFVF
jgi:hypothetical protein